MYKAILTYKQLVKLCAKLVDNRNVETNGRLLGRVNEKLKPVKSSPHNMMQSGRLEFDLPYHYEGNNVRVYDKGNKPLSGKFISNSNNTNVIIYGEDSKIVILGKFSETFRLIVKRLGAIITEV
jgi:hypothetical protein